LSIPGFIVFKYFLIVTLSVALVIPGRAQDSVRHEVGVATGVTFDAIKNTLTSPEPQEGTAVPIQLFYRKATASYRSYVQLTYVGINYTSPVSSYSTKEQKGYLQTGLFYHLPFGGRFRVFAGGILDAQAIHRTNWFKGNEFGNNGADQGTISLCPGVYGEADLAGGVVNAQLTTALFSFIGGAGYALSYRGETGWMWPGEYSSTQFRFGYFRKVAARLTVRADYQFTYRWLSRYEPVGWLSNQLLFSLSYTFSKGR
jgi:hypothetical protein